MDRFNFCVYQICVYIMYILHIHPSTHPAIHTDRQTYITLHYVTLQYGTVHYITLHYITYIHAYILLYIHTQALIAAYCLPAGSALLPPFPRIGIFPKIDFFEKASYMFDPGLQFTRSPPRPNKFYGPYTDKQWYPRMRRDAMLWTAVGHVNPASVLSFVHHPNKLGWRNLPVWGCGGIGPQKWMMYIVW